MAKANEIIPASVPDLDTYVAASVELAPEYWSPSEEGEMRRAVFVGCSTMAMPSADDPTVLIDLMCARFVYRVGDMAVTFCNGSKLLVGIFETQEVNQAYQITYLGRRANKNNTKSSGHWSVVQLKTKGKK